MELVFHWAVMPMGPLQLHVRSLELLRVLGIPASYLDVERQGDEDQPLQR